MHTLIIIHVNLCINQRSGAIWWLRAEHISADYRLNDANHSLVSTIDRLITLGVSEVDNFVFGLGGPGEVGGSSTPK